MKDSNCFIVTSKGVVKPRVYTKVKLGLLFLKKIALKNPACIEYVLLQDKNEKNVFIIHAKWKTRKDWQEHLQSKVMQKFSAQEIASTKELAFYELTLIEP